MEHKFKLVSLLVVLYLVSGVPGQDTDHLEHSEEHGREKRSIGITQLGDKCDTSAWNKYVGPFLIVDNKMSNLPRDSQPSPSLKTEHANLTQKLNEFKKNHDNNKNKICNVQPMFQCIKDRCKCRNGPVPQSYVEVNGRCRALRGSSCKNNTDCANPTQDPCDRDNYCGGYAAFMKASNSKSSSAGRECISRFALALITFSTILQKFVLF